MRPPLPLQTILQSRYQLLQVLGQGGFGRTYLAQDRGRFNELCALKELIPAQGGEYALEKSKELFQREAQILYQIKHPQIPQFRATFEEDQRLFLVQDYVEGPTYRHLLDQRKLEGYTFSEGEVRLLLQQLLPVLAHIHSKGIIHRDIAPDNIILREVDHKPVLIDFGVVKELATRLQFMTSLSPQPTTVGKPGYAPVEQMQSGQAYPCSDLYSLGVTAIVLLTGREPQELFDNSTLTWHWQRWATVSPQFTQVLNRMIAYRPGDRFQSVSEVMQALQTTYPQATPAPQPIPAPVPIPPHAGQTTAGQTLAVGRPPDMEPAATRPQPAEIEPTRVTVWDEPWAVALIGLALVALTGIGSWAIVRAIINNPPAPTPTPIAPSPTVTVAPTVAPSPTLTPSPTPTGPSVINQPVDLPPGTQTSRSGSLQANEIINYLVFASQGQQLTTSLSGNGALMTILGPNRQLFTDNANRVSFWQGSLPFTGEYTVQLRPVQGVDRANYRLDLTLQNPAPPPTPIPPSPSPSPPPTLPPQRVDTARVTFPPESNETSVNDRAGPNVIKRYLVNANRGSILSARIFPRGGSVRLTIRYPNGRPVENATGVLEWESEVTRDGEYQIDVIADQDTNFQLDIGLRQVAVPMPRTQ